MGEANPEAVAAILRAMRVAEPAAGAVGAEAPAAAADHLQPGPTMRRRIGDTAFRIGAVIVARPFPDVAGHIEEPERVRRIRAYRLRPTAVVIRAGRTDRRARAECLAASSTARVFPLGFRRQPESGPRAHAVETREEPFDVDMADALDRAPRAVLEVR